MNTDKVYIAMIEKLIPKAVTIMSPVISEDFLEKHQISRDEIQSLYNLSGGVGYVDLKEYGRVLASRGYVSATPYGDCTEKVFLILNGETASKVGVLSRHGQEVKSVLGYKKRSR